MEIKGKVLQLMAPQTGTGKKGEWKKQEFILETQAQYPKKVCLGLWGFDKECPPVGSLITAQIEIESREYNSKWYTEVRVWKLEINQRGSGGGQQSQKKEEPKQDPKKYEQETGFIADDEIPF